ncbi:hypothetical protein ABZU76_51175 [Amycolatopsis sp. NPDC005232]|uniref:hypothetical protein n=1 Tax=Amycolatopsis sp. NPDC005232 TaxID=3157027 RepID=UPI0033A23AE9
MHGGPGAEDRGRRRLTFHHGPVFRGGFAGIDATGGVEGEQPRGLDGVDVGATFVIGAGSLVLGLVLLLVCRRVYLAFFRR